MRMRVMLMRWVVVLCRHANMLPHAHQSANIHTGCRMYAFLAFASTDYP